MAEYYGFSFKRLKGTRGPRSLVTSDGSPPPEMPRPLRWVYGGSMAVSAAVLVLTAVFGKSDPFSISRWFAVPVVLFPIALALFAGFSHHQTWTRPLLVVLLFAAASCLFLAGYAPAALLVLGATYAAGHYLYRTEGPVEYYALLHENALVHVTRSDLVSEVMLPVYTGFVGAAVGVTAGYLLFERVAAHMGIEEGRDTTGLLCVCALLAFLLGSGGQALGEAYLRWRE